MVKIKAVLFEKAALPSPVMGWNPFVIAAVTKPLVRAGRALV